MGAMQKEDAIAQRERSAKGRLRKPKRSVAWAKR